MKVKYLCQFILFLTALTCPPLHAEEKDPHGPGKYKLYLRHIEVGHDIFLLPMFITFWSKNSHK
jgi:hypothetical protein